MELEGSLLCLQELSTGPEPDRSSQCETPKDYKENCDSGYVLYHILTTS
jgi:hypothetical protein